MLGSGERQGRCQLKKALKSRRLLLAGLPVAEATSSLPKEESGGPPGV